MEIYKQRLATFKHNKSANKKITLAKKGFFYDVHSGLIKCYKCVREVKDVSSHNPDGCLEARDIMASNSCSERVVDPDETSDSDALQNGSSLKSITFGSSDLEVTTQEKF